MKKDKKDLLVLLMKDESVIVCSEKSLPSNEDIEYILVPLKGFDSSSYIIVKSHKRMNFTKVTLNYKLTLKYYSESDSVDSIELTENSIETDSIITLYNLLNSFHRYTHISRFENVFIDERIPPHCYVTVDYFEIKMWCGEEMTYETSICKGKTDVSTIDLLQSIRKIYKSYLEFTSISDVNYITIHENEWREKSPKKLKPTDLIGVPELGVKTLTFVSYDDLRLIKESFKGISMNLNFVDTKVYRNLDDLTSDDLHSMMSKDVLPIKSVFHWIHEVNSVIELFGSFKLIEDICAVMINAYFSKFYPSDYTKMEIRPYWILCVDMLDMYMSSEIISFSDANRISLDNLLIALKSLERKLS